MTENPIERLGRLSRVNPTTGCIEWSGMSNRGGYGRLTVNGRTVSAHRYAFEVFVRAIPDGLCVCHHCDNRKCINPDHLFLGTLIDNAADRDRKGRNKNAPIRRGEASPRAKLTAAQVAEIRASSESSRAIAGRYGVDHSHIRALRRGDNFRPDPPAAVPQAEKENK